MAKDDKTEAPTQKKKKKARKDGQIPKSPELITGVQILVASYLLELTVHRASSALGKVLAQMTDARARPEEGGALQSFGTPPTAAPPALLPPTGALHAGGHTQA